MADDPGKSDHLPRKASVALWLVNEALARMWTSDRSTQLPEGAFAIIRKRGEDPIAIPASPFTSLLARKIAKRIGIPEDEWPASLK